VKGLQQRQGPPATGIASLDGIWVRTSFISKTTSPHPTIDDIPPHPCSHFTGKFGSDKSLLFHERAVSSGSKASSGNCRDVWAGGGRG